jgi:hypothetical protein
MRLKAVLFGLLSFTLAINVAWLILAPIQDKEVFWTAMISWPIYVAMSGISSYRISIGKGHRLSMITLVVLSIYMLFSGAAPFIIFVIQRIPIGTQHIAPFFRLYVPFVIYVTLLIVELKPWVRKNFIDAT